jgi:PIN domain nuclease of toxin-antitoxin system/bifunctional DNA-binding transcriptional regulator/antitoxin component of YhaV-PrlF toxin-antitoxin module
MRLLALDQVTVRVDASGRVVIPRDLRDALGIPDGWDLRFSVRDGELRATTRLAALRRIRAELRGLALAEPATEALIAGPKPPVGCLRIRCPPPPPPRPSRPDVADPTLLLDASALLALVFEEPGAAAVLAALDTAAIGAVNLAEGVELAARRGLDPARAGRLLAGLRRQGLSLGDAACLGTDAVLGLPVLTVDRLWAELETGVEVRLLR